ncbi:MAG: four helix bundle protein [Prevotella sp.]|nr:four helix bundle protein [Prevotella sp.]
MGTDNPLLEKTISFAIKIVNCFQYLQNEKKEFVMSKQLLRSGTSIGANAHEAIYGQSRADFVNKLNISLKEASETSYWIVILNRTGYFDDSIFKSLKKDLDEIIRIIIASIKTTRKNEKYIS